MSERNFFRESNDNTQPQPGSAGEAVANALNRLFGHSDEYHNIPAAQVKMAQADGTNTPTPKPSRNAFRMASDQSHHRRVNPAEAMEPQDQSVIPAVQAALSNPHNSVYEHHGDAIRKTSGTEGENGATLPSYAEEIGRGIWKNGLKTVESVQNNGISGAELVHSVFGGNRGGLDAAYDNKARLTKIIEDYEDETDRLHRDANSADKTLRGFYQEAGQAGVEGAKYFTTQGGTIANDALDAFSKLYHGHHDRTGERDIGLALEGGSKALAIYEGTYAAAYNALKPLPAPDSLKRFGAGMAASKTQDVFIENELNERRHRND